MASLSATMWSARLRRMPPSTLSGEPKSITQGSSPALCRMPTAPSDLVTSHMIADIIIGCTSNTGGPAGGCPGRLSGGKYRRSLYIGTLSTTWNGDGTVPVSSPPRRKTSRPFCAVAMRRSTGRVTAERCRSTAAPLIDLHILAHRAVLRSVARRPASPGSAALAIAAVRLRVDPLRPAPPPSRSPLFGCASTRFARLRRPRDRRCSVARRPASPGSAALAIAATLGCVAHLLGTEAVHLEYPTQVVFESLTVGVSDGDRIGIVGLNGDGKSSLLGLLTGSLRPDSGRVTCRSGLRVGALSQADTLDPGRTVGGTLVGERPAHEWAGDARVRDVVGGLVSDIDWDARVATLSGGLRRRVQLAALLIGEWDVIALDEPTNHLDIDGITWLAGHLGQRWPRNVGGLLVVTHDRWFLDEVATTTWEVHDGTVEPFEGGYAAYVLQRLERDRRAAVAEAKRQNLMRKELAWLRS